MKKGVRVREIAWFKGKGKVYLTNGKQSPVMESRDVRKWLKVRDLA